MASIPHGTTVNAQGTTSVIAGPPTIPRVDITPSFLPPRTGTNRFASQTATAQGTARIPQDLTRFIADGRITQAILDDPNTVLRDVIAHQTIVSTTQVSISTVAERPIVAGGGVDNIAFLVNSGPDTIGSPNGPNAQTTQMDATFWIETVERTLVIPPFKPGQPPLKFPLHDQVTSTTTPQLSVNPGREVNTPTTIRLRFTQIQYSQVVFLNFNGLKWPHVSVATLVPGTVNVPSSAWG
jgi:hypothetical protein